MQHDGKTLAAEADLPFLSCRAVGTKPGFRASNSLRRLAELRRVQMSSSGDRGMGALMLGT